MNTSRILSSRISPARIALATLFGIVAAAHAQSFTGEFSAVNLGAGNSDTAVGLSANKSFLHAYNLGEAVNVSVNGVSFTGVAGANPTVASVFSTSGLGNVYGGGGTNPAGQLGALTNKFVYGATTVAEVVTLSNLTIGNTYIYTLYTRSWEATARAANMTATGASVTPGGFSFNENVGATAQGDLVMMRYTFQATSTTQTISAAPAVSGTTIHMTAFTTENVFNNSWSSGTNWTTATWGGPGVPNSAGSNANFSAQGVPTSINLNANVTAGHVQFDGANAWTVSGSNTLNLQADAGGVSTISAKSGSHTISAPISLANNLMKLGAGNVTLSGAVSGGARSIHNAAGTLTLANSANSFTGELIMAGNGIVNVASLSDYGVPSAIGARTLAQENTTVTGVGLHFQGGMLQYTGSTPQSTNRHIRMYIGNNTIDASGSNPAATLSFTQSGTNMNLFDTGGTRTLVLTGTNTGNNLFALQLTNQATSATSVTKTGTGTWDLSSAASTYTGATTVQQGTLNLSGARTAAAGAINVANTTGQSAVLNIRNGTLSVGTVTVAAGDSTVIGTVNQTGGALTLTGTQAIIGNGTGGNGTYNLSAGSLTGTASGNRGVILGVNSGARGTFNLTGSGNLNLTGANLQLGRSENTAAINTTGVFNQTGGAATVGTLSMGGLVSINTGASGTMNFTGGTFVAASINGFGGGDNSVAAINIGGTAQVTLPAFPTLRGIGANTSVTFDGGTLKAGASSATYMENLTSAQIKNGGFNFNSNGQDVTINQVLTDFAGQTGTLTKSGNGIMTLTAASTYSGATTVNGGTLRVNGSLGGGAVNVNSGGTIAGTGTIPGGILAGANGRIAPGASVGTLTVGTTTLNAGSLLDFEINGAANDLLNVTGSGGLAINGGGFNLFTENTATPWTTNGTYALIDYNTSYTGSIGNLSLLNAAVGKFYTVGDDTGATAITITIADATTSEWNGVAADGLWTTGGNWNAGSPNGVGVVAKFGTIPTGATAVTVSGAKTLGGIIFDNANSYSVNGGAGDTITLENGIASAAIGVTSGSHTIAAPIALNAALDSQPGAGTQVTFAGPISGTKSVSQNGAGTSVLTGANSYATTQVNLGTLQVGAGGTSGTLGSGDATVAAGATLAFNRGDDISVATNIGGAGTVSKLGNNTVTFTGANTFATLSVAAGTAKIAGTNTFGLLNVAGGFAQVGSATGVSTTAIVNVGALGTFDVNEVNTTLAGITGTGLITDNGFNPGQTTLTINNAANVTFSGRIEDGFDRTVAFAKTGAGTLTIDGTAVNSYTGGTTVANGTLALGRTSGTALSGAITIGDAVGADVLQLNAPDQIDNASVLSFTAGGAGNSAFFRINGNNETVRGITTTVANAAVIENNGPVAASTATLTVDTAGASYTYDGIIRNASAGSTAIMALTKAGAGTLTLKNTALVGTTSYTGATTVTGGKLVLENFASFASPLNLTSADADAVTFAQNSVDLAYTAIISGTGGLVKTGNNTLTLSGVNTQTGSTTINAGTLGIGNNAAFGTGTIVMNGGIIRASGAARSMANPVTVNGSFTLGRLTDLTGAITLNADATITASNPDGLANNNSILGPVGGNFRLTLAEGAGGAVAPFGIGTGALVINAVNTNSGTTVSSGRATVSATGALSTGPLTVTSGALNLNNAAQTVSSLDGAGGTMTLGATTVLTDAQDSDTTFSGVIAGSGALIKSGIGKLTLAGINTLTGATTVNGGTLAVSGSLSGSAVALNSATLSGLGSVGAVTSIGGTIAPGASPGTLTVAALTLDSASALNFELSTAGIIGSGVNDLLAIGGALTLDGTLNITELSGFGNGTYRLANYGGAFTDNGLDLTPTFLANYPGSNVDVATTGEVNLVVVPEPGSAVLLLAGLGAMIARRRRID